VTDPAPTDPARPADDPTKQPKMIAGGGGCCCAFAALLGVVSVILLILGSERKTQEALPFGIIGSILTVLAGLLGAAVLGYGLYALSQAKKRREEQG